MNPFVKFMQTPAGRVGRIVAGLALIGAGVLGVSGAQGYLLAILGLVPLGAGLFDICLLAPFFRIPFSGAKIRAMQ
jgi:hypothetical protein